MIKSVDNIMVWDLAWLKIRPILKTGVIVLCLFCMGITSCSSGRYSPKFYTRNQLAFDQLPALYENVPFYQDSAIYRFIIQLQNPEIPDDVMKKGLVGTVVSHPLIDENGGLEAVYIQEPLHPLVDEAVILAVRNSLFRARQEVTGQSGKYSLIIPFQFYFLYEKELDYFFRNKKADDQPEE